MSRIIAGLAGSIRLAPAPSGTRPSSDRLKESLFSQLENLGAIEGANVLDLFAGTGALGLEALSRGAKSLVGIDSNRAAVQVCLRNASKVCNVLAQYGQIPRVKFFVSDASRYVRTTPEMFDLILLDPPYSLPAERISALISLSLASAAAHGHIVTECASKSRLDTPNGMTLIDTRSFGDSKTIIWQRSS